MIWIDWLIIALVALLVGFAVYIMIKERKKGKSLDCSNCPLNKNCLHKQDDCQKQSKNSME